MFSAIFVKDSDVAKLTFCAIDDPRTLNKTLYLRPPGNICSMNELVEMWEYKIDKKLKKIYISEEELLKDINGMYHVSNIVLVLFVESSTLMWLILWYLISRYTISKEYGHDIHIFRFYQG
jgi:NmrA-like family